MTSCDRCGAQLALDAPKCPYCGTTTPYGHQLEEHERAQAWHQQQQQLAAADNERRTAQVAVDTKARHSVIWSLLGLLGCCFPVSIVGIVLALRAKGIAKERSLIAPGSATAGLVLGITGLLVFAAFGVFVVVLELGIAERKGELHKIIDRGAGAATLDHGTACALTELRLLEDGYSGVGGLSIEDFECPGKLTQTSDRASLSGVRFRPGSKSPATVTVCLNRGASWSVDRLLETGSCSDGK